MSLDRGYCETPTQCPGITTVGACDYAYGFGSPSPTGPRKKGKAPARRRSITSVACFTCQQRKSKCDGARPFCTPCRKSGYLRDCHYELPNDTKRSVYLKKGIADTEQENTALKKLIQLQRSSSKHRVHGPAVRYELAHLTNLRFVDTSSTLCRIWSAIGLDPDSSESFQFAQSLQHDEEARRGWAINSTQSQFDAVTDESRYSSPISTTSQIHNVTNCLNAPIYLTMVHKIDASQDLHAPPAQVPFRYIPYHIDHQTLSETPSPASTPSDEQFYITGHMPATYMASAPSMPQYLQSCEDAAPNYVLATMPDVYSQWTPEIYCDSNVSWHADVSSASHDLHEYPMVSHTDRHSYWIPPTLPEIDHKPAFSQDWSEVATSSVNGLPMLPHNSWFQPYKLCSDAMQERVQQEYGHFHTFHESISLAMT